MRTCGGKLPAKHKLRVQDEAIDRLLAHADFVSNESVSASIKLLDGFNESIDMIAERPLMYQFADERDAPGIPPKTYRRCVLMKNYKILYRMEDETVVVAAVIDSRSENKGLFENAPDQANETAGEAAHLELFSY